MAAAHTTPSTWLVTGGVGFIGHHVTSALLARGDRVTIVDDFSDAPYPAREKRRNAGDLVREFGDRVTIVEGCITDRALVRARASGAQGVLHLAGLAGVRPSYDDPARYARVNTEGTATVFEAIRDAGVRNFVFASTSSVYGNGTPLPAEEDAPCITPESPYAASKRGAELVLSTLAKKHPETAVTALRFFTVYGPRQRPEMAITLFARKILAGERIVVFGDGSMKRDFTHVDDITRGVLLALAAERPGFRVYNLGSGAPVTLGDLVRGLERATRRTAAVDHAPVPLGDVDATFASIERAKRDLGWEPAIPLEMGLASVVAWVTRQSA